MLTPVMVLNTVNIVVITPALTAILASDIDLNEPWLSYLFAQSRIT